VKVHGSTNYTAEALPHMNYAARPSRYRSNAVNSDYIPCFLTPENFLERRPSQFQMPMALAASTNNF
jgi:hypothetical protein